MSGIETVGLTTTAGLATITLRRAGASNALDREVKERLSAAVEAVAADRTVRALFLEAEGRNFCVGQDLTEHAAGLASDPRTGDGYRRRALQPVTHCARRSARTGGRRDQRGGVRGGGRAGYRVGRRHPHRRGRAQGSPPPSPGSDWRAIPD